MSKAFMVCFALLTLLLVGQGFYCASLHQRLTLTEQLAAQQVAEAQGHIAALEAAQALRDMQINALQTLAQGCEQSRVQDAADAAARQAILGAVSAHAAKAAPEQSPDSPLENSPKETSHDSTRAAVAKRLNRPL